MNTVRKRVLVHSLLSKNQTIKQKEDNFEAK